MKKEFSLISCVLSSALVGVVFGILSNFSILKGRWESLILWAFIGLLLGAYIEQRRFVIWSGLFYGFFITAAFLASGFQGSSSEIFSFTILSLVLSIVGALCGWCLVFAGNWLKRRLM